MGDCIEEREVGIEIVLDSVSDLGEWEERMEAEGRVRRVEKDLGRC